MAALSEISAIFADELSKAIHYDETITADKENHGCRDAGAGHVTESEGCRRLHRLRTCLWGVGTERPQHLYCRG